MCCCIQEYPLIGYTLPKSISRIKAKKYRKLLAKARFSNRAKRVQHCAMTIFEHEIMIDICPDIGQQKLRKMLGDVPTGGHARLLDHSGKDQTVIVRCFAGHAKPDLH